MAKMSKAERKAAKRKEHAEKTVQKTETVPERNLGYDADFFVNNEGMEIEFVRPDFVFKPEWYSSMLQARKIHYRSNELQALCSDGQWYAAKDTASGLAKMPDGNVVLMEDKELKNNWTYVATTSSCPNLANKNKS